MKKIKFGILEVGVPPSELEEAHGSYPDMFKTLLNQAVKSFLNLDFEFQYFQVLDGDIPSDPSLCDAWLITGSKFGVYEAHVWIEPLSSLVKSCYQQDVPMIGICFGHQLIAQALGGKVIKSNKGWSLGVQEYRLEQQPSWLQDTQDVFSIQAYHQDQVVELPENTQILASSEFCPLAALNFNDRAISFQGHPEFDPHYTKKLLCSRRDMQLLPIELSNQAIDLVNTPIQRELVAKWICQFLEFKLSSANSSHI
ncbi:MAG: gamma-glutamyl-gamma-aminobutyrate hydrolase family protein [Oceanospirillaceae bacterium]|nr:gamma-glutamyl-gamma-aminobutyrate hydrolase family protein [Oceanospirillaceae bacterium]